jgi:hypothetical protein
MTSAIRLRRLIAEDQPLISGYDEELFARTLFYTSRPIVPSLAAFKAARETSADILDRLSEAQWARGGSHSESGPYGVETWLKIYTSHAHDHADQLLRAAGRRLGFEVSGVGLGFRYGRDDQPDCQLSAGLPDNGGAEREQERGGP